MKSELAVILITLVTANYANYTSRSKRDVAWNGNNWAMQCDFPGQDMSNVRISSDQCGGKCAATQGCTHFSWTNSWNGKAPVNRPVNTCSKDGMSVLGVNEQSGCGGGPAYTCSNQQPYVGSGNVAYGFAAANLPGSSEWGWCCSCYELTFTSGPVNGQKMIVQVTNTGGDLGSNHFDLQIPGGGVGIFNGCSSQWNAPANGWGDRYGGVKSVGDCDQLPKQIRDGCKWRFGWFKNADNPTMNLRPVSCPAELTSKSGCARN